ncbi:helix-turn-helix domain-containing protein [Maribellus sediminis]|uniref:helix-turn-helix domain-containing protein n=1 Tax=Maribellus sediminis TaxID=2696285 RepID=UPI0014317944|nr:helix-turn-helix domain-containing protein [Maribellus sediminis]
MKKDKIVEAFEAFVKPIVDECVRQALHKDNTTLIKDPEQFITVGKALEEFGCTDHMLRRAINNNELSYYQPNRRLYLKRGDVAAYFQSIKIISKDEPQDYNFLK